MKPSAVVTSHGLRRRSHRSRTVDLPDAAGAAVLQHEHTVASIDRLPGGPLYRELSGHPGEHQGVDIPEPQQAIQLSPGQRAHPRL